MIHDLKTDPSPFAAIRGGIKNFELRLNDRDFQPLDVLRLRETRYSGREMSIDGRPLEYTGAEIAARVLYVATGPEHGLAEKWVVMALAPIALSQTPLGDLGHHDWDTAVNGPREK